MGMVWGDWFVGFVWLSGEGGGDSAWPAKGRVGADNNNWGWWHEDKSRVPFEEG